jgi:diketogulonate reductase-like aldo/keto reductase
MNRRDLLLHLVPLLGTSGLHAQSAQAPPVLAPVLTRPIASSGEQIPVVGLGSWITFNVGNDGPARAHCAEVVRQFFAAGGRLIDSSPMYGSSQGVIGEALQKLPSLSRVFAADKVWTASPGATQIGASLQRWQVPRFDLLQVHNLLGLTTSEGRRHGELAQIMRTQPIDFVQFSYNLLDREAEQQLLPLARERGIAVLVNRPFRQGALLRQLQRHPLPGWAAEIDCASWAQVALKFVVSHPDVTCAIPATRNTAHVRENMAAARGRQPDAALRQRMAEQVQRL